MRERLLFPPTAELEYETIDFVRGISEQIVWQSKKTQDGLRRNSHLLH